MIKRTIPLWIPSEMSQRIDLLQAALPESPAKKGPMVAMLITRGLREIEADPSVLTKKGSKRRG